MTKMSEISVEDVIAGLHRQVGALKEQRDARIKSQAADMFEATATLSSIIVVQCLEYALTEALERSKPQPPEGVRPRRRIAIDADQKE